MGILDVPGFSRSEADARFANAASVASAYTVATRGFPKRARPTTKMLGFFGAAGHGWGTAGSGFTPQLNDTAMPMLGTQSARVTFTAAGQAQIQKTDFAPFSVVNTHLRLTLRVDAPAFTAFTVMLGSDAAFVNRVQKNVFSAGDTANNTDYTIDVSLGDFTVGGGTPDLNSIVAVRVLINATGAGSAWLGQVALTADAMVQMPAGAVVISLDDTNSDHWTYARPKLAQYGMGATLYPVCESFGLAGKYSISQATYMQDVQGFDVGYHAFTAADHTNWTAALTEPEVRSQIESIIGFNRANNFRGDSFAYPNTTSTPLIQRVVADYCRSARGGNGNYNEVFPPGNAMNLRAANAGSFTLAQMKAKVDAAKSGHSLVHFFFHSLPATKVEANDVARQDFYDLIDYIAAQGVPVLTASQFMALSLTA